MIYNNFIPVEPNEVSGDWRSTKAVANKIKPIAVASPIKSVLKIIKKNNLNIIKVRYSKIKDKIYFKRYYGVTYLLVIYLNGYEKEAKELEEIMKRNNGFIQSNNPNEVYRIGQLLNYKEENIKRYIKNVVL